MPGGQELRRGNLNAWRHGIFAVTGNWRDVATEAALIYEARPSLDPVVDRRLVEDLALARVQRMRAAAAILREGPTSVLTSYETRLAALVERLERAVHERAKERVADLRARPLVDISRYRLPERQAKESGHDD